MKLSQSGRQRGLSLLLVVAIVLWVPLVPSVLRHWVTPTVGVSLVLTVSTESLAVLSATVAAGDHVRWLLDAALAPFALGLAFYVFVIARFDLRDLTAGEGDQWITGGALAISIAPVLGLISPAATLSSVVLPQPVGPTIDTNSPSAISSEARSTAV